MLEDRVSALEADLGKVRALLERLEPRITELLLSSAKQADLHKARTDIAKIDGRIAGIEGKIAGVEGRIAGVDARVSSLPTTWTILGIVFTTWALGSGLLIFTLTRLLGK